MTTLLGLGLTRKKKASTVDRVLDSINDEYSPAPSARKSEVRDISFPIPEMPTKLAGGRINLIRAVNDDAEKRIKEIVARRAEIAAEDAQLAVELEAHTEMLAVARKYVNKLTVTVTK